MSDLKEFYEDHIAKARQEMTRVISQAEIDYEQRAQEIEQKFSNPVAKNLMLDSATKMRDTRIETATTMWNKNIAEWQNELNKLVNQ